MARADLHLVSSGPPPRNVVIQRLDEHYAGLIRVATLMGDQDAVMRLGLDCERCRAIIDAYYEDPANVTPGN